MTLYERVVVPSNDYSQTLPIDMANALVLNAGSGGQKVALYAIDPDPEGPTAPVWQAAINSTTPGQPEDKFLAQIKS